MAIFDYNLYFTSVYSSGNGGEFATIDVDNFTGTIAEPDADDSFELGDSIATSTGSPALVGLTYVGNVDVNGATFAVFGQTDSLVVSDQYYFVAHEDVPANFTGQSTPIPGASVTSDAFTASLCFAAGTLIATPSGESVVETLEIGDLVTTADGRTVPVKWVGHQTLHKVFTPADNFTPVRVSAGALGDGLPHTDLVLTTDHALIMDGLAITAGALVNGSTIAFEPIESLPDRVTYYHVETEDHDVILANGTAAETFLDVGTRRNFDNHAEYVALYGTERMVAEMPLPRVSSARLVPAALRARIGTDTAA
ncbi:MAG: hypothetical protein CMH12_18515 [Maritimibacter sp.]|nr:hypothetical protein [Maritimibacter sp.]